MSVYLILGIVGILLVLSILLGTVFCVVKQNHVYVLTIFGKYSRCLSPGLHIKAPWESRFKLCSLQMMSEKAELQAITKDQANVDFEITMVFSVKDSSVETIKDVAFKFESFNAFLTTLRGLIEGEIRTVVAGYAQETILGIREELSTLVMERVNFQIMQWGYTVHNLQLTNVSFDAVIMESMSKVVEAQNKMKAAENVGKAAYIEATKKAEAEGKALTVKAEAEKAAMLLRGEGLASFRKAITEGLATSMETFKENGVDPSILVQYMYMETLKDVAKEGTGHLVFMDNGAGAATRFMQQLKGLTLPVETAQVQEEVETVS